MTAGPFVELIQHFRCRILIALSVRILLHDVDTRRQTGKRYAVVPVFADVNAEMLDQVPPVEVFQMIDLIVRQRCRADFPRVLALGLISVPVVSDMEFLPLCFARLHEAAFFYSPYYACFSIKFSPFGADGIKEA